VGEGAGAGPATEARAMTTLEQRGLAPFDPFSATAFASSRNIPAQHLR
jgi:hypothetical protein